MACPGKASSSLLCPCPSLGFLGSDKEKDLALTQDLHLAIQPYPGVDGVAPAGLLGLSGHSDISSPRGLLGPTAPFVSESFLFIGRAPARFPSSRRRCPPLLDYPAVHIRLFAGCSMIRSTGNSHTPPFHVTSVPSLPPFPAGHVSWKLIYGFPLVLALFLAAREEQFLFFPPRPPRLPGRPLFCSRFSSSPCLRWFLKSPGF